MPRSRAQLDLAGLADEFGRAGPAAATAAALARAAGVAKPTLYTHGGSKEALLLRAVEAEVERVVGALAAAERATEGRPAADRGAAYARALLDHAAARPHGARLLHRIAPAGPPSPAAARPDAPPSGPPALRAAARGAGTGSGAAGGGVAPDAVALAVRRLPERLADGLRRPLVAEGHAPGEAAWVARALLGSTVALLEVRPGERRPARAVLATLAARVVPPPTAVTTDDWPSA